MCLSERIYQGITIIASLAEEVTDEAPPAIEVPNDVIVIGDDDPLPQQGSVTAVPGAPPVEAGKQGKHVPGHKNHNPSEKTSWNPGENGVRPTQEAWKNSKPKPKRPNIRIGRSSDGRTIEIHFGKDGIHGFPIG